MIHEISYLYDAKTGCHSYLCTVDLQWYLEVTKDAYMGGGGIEGQRTALNTQSGRRIRKQMVDDFSAGGILPPVVIGVENQDLSCGDRLILPDLLKTITKASSSGDLSILDGMQRTTAMREAIDYNSEQSSFESRTIRVEFWVAQKIHSLLYRMLVLNTGQVPWSLRRQVEVVFYSLKKEMKARIIGLNLIEVDDGSRRVTAGTFHANKLIEAFMIIGTRSERIDLKEKIADDFLKLDFIENSSDKELTAYFFDILQIIVDIDIALSSIASDNEISQARFCRGLDIFSSQPALTGFCAAIAQYIFGRPGTHFSREYQEGNMEKIKSGFNILLAEMQTKSPDELREFVAFDVLNEQISTLGKSSKIGDEERIFFKNAFRVIIEEKYQLHTMEVCWRV